jgi:two-component system, NtrC family, sensor kinase
MAASNLRPRPDMLENAVTTAPAVVLVVDDTEAQRYAVVRMLRSAGHTVIEAGTGKQARQHIKTGHPEIVILDVNLPDESGFDICRDLKRDAATATLPVLQISASFVSVRDRVHGLEGGADAYLTPPLDSTELLATVNALLRMKRAEERARREAMLAEHARAELSAVLSSMAEGLIQLDRTGRVVYVNATGAQMLGAETDHFIGLPFQDAVHARKGDENERLATVKLIEPLPQTVRSAETTFHARDGRPLMVEYTSAPLIEDEEVTGAVVSFRDISERKRAEEALRVTEKLATTGRMAATIAHEINNPLEAVTNLLYLIGHNPGLNETIKGYAAMAEQELARVTHITRQTLGFYRRSETPTQFDVREILESVLSIYRRRFESGAITIVRKYRFDQPVQGFSGELRQVFSNLLINAIEAVKDKGQIVLHVSPWRDWARRGELCGVRVAVADNGPGIAVERRSHVFEPFFTTKGEKGTGLGLWVSHGIVRKHGGMIRMRSRSGGKATGTCFTVYLPFGGSAPHSEVRQEHDASQQQ